MFLFVKVLCQASRCNHLVYIIHIQIETITCMTRKLTSAVGHKKTAQRTGISIAQVGVSLTGVEVQGIHT